MKRETDENIKYVLDDELVRLYDTLRDLIFKDRDIYYTESMMMPIWCQDAGQNSDCAASADFFQRCVGEQVGLIKEGRTVPDLYKHLYLVDCQFLVGTIQNLLSSMEDAYTRYFAIMDGMKGRTLCRTFADGTFCEMSETSRQASSSLETYFTKAYSILDILCKICFEIQYKNEDFSEYRKLRSAKVLWGDRKKLAVNGKEHTLFEKCELISMIESLRNEVVHNGTWELNPKVFVRLENGKVQECFMLFPDMEQGRLASVKNRRHFFSKGIKVSDILPEIHREFQERLLNTIRVVNRSQ